LTVAAASILRDTPAVALQRGCSLRVYHNFTDLAELRSEWNGLLDVYPLATTFSTWEWLSSWWRSNKQGRQLLALALFDARGSLSGLALFSLTSERFRGSLPLRVFRLLGDGTFDSDNLDMPVAPGMETTFADAILNYLQSHRAAWDACELNTFPLNSPMADSLSQSLKSRGWPRHEASTGSSAIQLPRSWNEYLQLLSSEDRKNLARYTRRLQSHYDTRIYRCSDARELPALLGALFGLHQARWQSDGEPGSFSSQARRDFYSDLSAQLLARNWLEMWVLELDRQIAAVQFAFRYGDRVFQLQEGYDHTRSADRPGYILRGEVLKTLISEGVRIYDFLGGEDAYKSRWGALPGHYRAIEFAMPLTRGAVALWAARRAGSGKEWLRRRLPQPAWTMLQRAKSLVRGESRGSLPDKRELHTNGQSLHVKSSKSC
jgi:CelD/BcsL family acetyltransferase involved in cellulose biosynthesis